MKDDKVIVHVPHGTVPSPTSLEKIREVAPVTASRRVYKGDMLAITRELERDGTPMRVAYEGAKLLAADSSNLVNDLHREKNGVLVWCFTQEGYTYLKTAKWVGGDLGWQLGATVCVGEIEPERATVTYVRADLSPHDYNTEPKEYVILLYEDEGQGAGVRYTLNDLALSEPVSFVWCEEEAPRNFAACWAPAKDWESDVDEHCDYCEFVSVARLTADGNIAISAIAVPVPMVCSTVVIPAGTYETSPEWRERTWLYKVAAPMDEDYATSAWHLQCQRTHGACFLTYPTADGKRYILEYLIRRYTDEETGNSRFEAWPYGGKVMICNHYEPCGGGVSNLDGREVDASNRNMPIPSVEFDIAPMPWLVGIIARTAGGDAQKTMLGMERFLGGKQHFLTPLGWIETKDHPQSSMGLLSCCRCGPYKSTMAVGYESGGKYRAGLVYLLGTTMDSPLMEFSVGMPLIQEPVCGPEVEVADVDTAAMLLECDRDPAILYQKSGSIFLQKLAIKTVVSPTKERRLTDAVAVTGGSPGTTIKIVTLRPDQQAEEEAEDTVEPEDPVEAPEDGEAT